MKVIDRPANLTVHLQEHVRVHTIKSLKKVSNGHIKTSSSSVGSQIGSLVQTCLNDDRPNRLYCYIVHYKNDLWFFFADSEAEVMAKLDSVKTKPTSERAKIRKIHALISKAMNAIEGWKKRGYGPAFHAAANVILGAKSWREIIDYESIGYEGSAFRGVLNNVKIAMERHCATDAEMEEAWKMWQIEKTLAE